MCKVEFNLMWLSIWNLQVIISSKYRWTEWNQKASDHSHRVIIFKTYEIDQIWCSALWQFGVQAKLTGVPCAGNYTFGNYKGNKLNFFLFGPSVYVIRAQDVRNSESLWKRAFSDSHLQFKKYIYNLYKTEYRWCQTPSSSSYITEKRSYLQTYTKRKGLYWKGLTI